MEVVGELALGFEYESLGVPALPLLCCVVVLEKEGKDLLPSLLPLPLMEGGRVGPMGSWEQENCPCP